MCWLRKTAQGSKNVGDAVDFFKMFGAPFTDLISGIHARGEIGWGVELDCAAWSTAVDDAGTEGGGEWWERVAEVRVDGINRDVSLGTEDRE